MTPEDSELLALAAKAHGFVDDATSDADTPGLHLGVDGIAYMVTAGGWHPWNPRDNSADAFALQVRLGFKVKYNEALGQALVWDHMGRETVENVEANGREPEAATRRAITRAAAALAQGAGNG